MTEEKQKRSKRNVLVMPLFQGRIVFIVALAGLLCTALNGFLYYSYIVDSYDFILQHARLTPEIKAQRYDDLFVFGLSLAVATLVTTLAIAIWGLFVTHRAAGSVYHLQRVIQEIKAGSTSARVHLRQKDEFQELAKSFNELMDQLQASDTSPRATTAIPSIGIR